MQYDKPDPRPESYCQRYAHVVENMVRGKGNSLQETMLDLVVPQKLDTRNLQVQGRQNQHWIEEESLELSHEKTRITFAFQLILRERNQRDANIRINIYYIGIGMMSIMLVTPPGKAHAKQKVPGDQPEGKMLYALPSAREYR